VESDPVFSFQDSRLVYTVNQHLYSWEISTGQTDQLTNFQKGNPPPRPLAADNGNARGKMAQAGSAEYLRCVKNPENEAGFYRFGRPPTPPKQRLLERFT
jgi:hypothetical protein